MRTTGNGGGLISLVVRWASSSWGRLFSWWAVTRLWDLQGSRTGVKFSQTGLPILESVNMGELIDLHFPPRHELTGLLTGHRLRDEYSRAAHGSGICLELVEIWHNHITSLNCKYRKRSTGKQETQWTDDPTGHRFGKEGSGKYPRGRVLHATSQLKS